MCSVDRVRHEWFIFLQPLGAVDVSLVHPCKVEEGFHNQRLVGQQEFINRCIALWRKVL